jgi:hypothetical protein
LATVSWTSDAVFAATTETVAANRRYGEGVMEQGTPAARVGHVEVPSAWALTSRDGCCEGAGIHEEDIFQWPEGGNHLEAGITVCYVGVVTPPHDATGETRQDAGAQALWDGRVADIDYLDAGTPISYIGIAAR